MIVFICGALETTGLDALVNQRTQEFHNKDTFEVFNLLDLEEHKLYVIQTKCCTTGECYAASFLLTSCWKTLEWAFPYDYFGHFYIWMPVFCTFK